MTHIRRSAALTLVAVTLAIAACGGDDDSDATTATTAPAAEPAAPTGPAASGEVDEDDVEFAQGMIAHHEQAIEMSELALDPAAGARAEVVDLAQRIQAAQDPEIDLMTGWLTAWGEPVQMDTSNGHDMDDMAGMMTAEEMDALAASSGADFDRMWLEMMIEHHEGAIEQSETVLSAGTDPAVRALAEQIITAQRAEIDEMRALLG